MAYSFINAPTLPVRPRPTILGMINHILIRLGDKALDFLAERESRQILDSLDDRMRRDIGI